MAGMIFFTDNYQDRSTNDGYQFEFFCRRCGNGSHAEHQLIQDAPRLEGARQRRLPGADRLRVVINTPWETRWADIDLPSR